jgi:hypothetical protein
LRRNTGKTPALGVRAEVTPWWWEEVEHMQHTWKWHVRILAGFDLPWTREGPRERGGASEVKVAPGASELLDVASYGLNAKRSLVPSNERRAVDDFSWHLSPYSIREYRAEIRVVSDNAKSALQTVLFEATLQAAGFARCEKSEPHRGRDRRLGAGPHQVGEPTSVLFVSKREQRAAESDSSNERTTAKP